LYLTSVGDPCSCDDTKGQEECKRFSLGKRLVLFASGFVRFSFSLKVRYDTCYVRVGRSGSQLQTLEVGWLFWVFQDPWQEHERVSRCWFAVQEMLCRRFFSQLSPGLDRQIGGLHQF